jgi:hypothetical protein
MVYTADLKSADFGHAGSSPARGTTLVSYNGILLQSDTLANQVRLLVRAPIFAPVPQLVEGSDLNPVQCQFESDQGYQR